MKNLGIILAAGKSSRLYPATFATTKQLLPIYDKPLIYYPLSALMLGGISDIIVITSPGEHDNFRKMWTMSQFDRFLQTEFMIQQQPIGIPDAYNIAGQSELIRDNDYNKVVMILGDNMFHGSGLTGLLQSTFGSQDFGSPGKETARVYGVKVQDLERFGVATVDRGIVTKLVEKPRVIEDRKNSYAVTGLYVTPMDVFNRVKNLKPSTRGETEMPDLLETYREERRLTLHTLARGITWFDTGTAESMLDASQYVRTVQQYQGQLVCSPHEIAFRNGWLNKTDLEFYFNTDNKSHYSQKLDELIE